MEYCTNEHMREYIMQNQSSRFFSQGSSTRHFPENSTAINESIVSTCSTGVSATDQQCFTNSACYVETPVSKATGQLQWNNLSHSGYYQNVSAQRWGTAFFIAPNLIMTAGHCFDIETGKNHWITPHNGSVYLTPQQFAPMIKLNMNYAYQSCIPSSSDLPSANEISFKITKLVEHRIAGLDYAIAEVEGNPGSTYGYVSFDFGFTAGNIFIVQHPDGAPKKQEFGYGWISSDQQMIRHNANTLGGSSGSCVAPSPNTGCGVHIQGTNGTGMNTAVPINVIQQKSPIVYGFFQLQHPSIFKEPSMSSSTQLNKVDQDQTALLFTLGTLATAGVVGGGIACLTTKDKMIQKIGVASIVAGIILGVVLIILLQQQRQNQEDEKIEIVNPMQGFGY